MPGAFDERFNSLASVVVESASSSVSLYSVNWCSTKSSSESSITIGADGDDAAFGVAAAVVAAVRSTISMLRPISTSSIID